MPIAKLQVTGSKVSRRTARPNAIDPITLSDKELEAIASSAPVGRKWNLTDSD